MCPELTHRKFHLHSILMEDLSFFIYDSSIDKWRQYVDGEIFTVYKKRVAVNPADVIALVYITDELLNDSDDLHYFNLEPENSVTDIYNNFIPEKLWREVDIDNLLFQEDYSKKKNEQEVKKIKKLYLERDNQIQNKYKSAKNIEA